MVDIKCENHLGQLTKKWITPDMIELAKLFESVSASFSVEHMDITYWHEASNRGPMGWIGPAGPSDQRAEKKIDELPNIDEKNMKFVIKFLKPISELDKENIQTILNKIKVTPSHNQRYILKSTFNPPIYESVEAHYGVYKKPHYDQISSLMGYTDDKQLMSYREDRDRYCCRSGESYGINEDFVDIKPYQGEDQCIWSFHEQESRPTGTYELFINLIAIDIKPNLDILRELIAYLQII